MTAETLQFDGFLSVTWVKMVVLSLLPIISKQPPPPEYKLSRSQTLKWEVSHLSQYDCWVGVAGNCPAPAIWRVAREWLRIKSAFSPSNSSRIDCCISMGVHYCDISGEIPWSRRITPLNYYAQRNKAGDILCTQMLDMKRRGIHGDSGRFK